MSVATEGPTQSGNENLPLLHSSEEVETRSATFMDAFLALLKSFIGAGLLALPFAFSKAGMAGGLIVSVLVPIMCNWATKSLVYSKHKIETNHAVAGLTFQDITKMILGDWAYYVVVFSLFCCQLGACVAYHIFVARSIDGLVEGDIKHMGSWYTFMVIMLCPIFIGLLQIKNIKRLVPFATAANFLIIFTLVFIVCYGFIDVCHGTDAKPCGNVQELRLDTIAITLGISTFAMEGVFVVLPVYDSMHDPRQIVRVLDLTFAVAGTLCATFGMLGYFVWGQATASVITLNMHHGSAVFTTVCISCVLLLSYPIQMFPVTQYLDSAVRVIATKVTERITGSSADVAEVGTLRPWQRAIRVFSVMLTGMVAFFFPHFGSVLSLIGAVGYSIAGFAMPAMIYDRLLTAENKKRGIAAILVTSFGVFVLVSGLIVNIKAIIDDDAS